jgi:hypothetical protein
VSTTDPDAAYFSKGDRASKLGYFDNGSVANLFRKSEDGLNPSGADHVRVQVASF